MAYLRAFGCCLPSNIVDNQAVAARTGREPASIEKSSGILTRRYAAESDSVASLGAEAARDCLSRAGLSASDVGLILVSSGSPERTFPGPASAIATQLGLASTPAIDLPIASAGSLFALALANDLALRYGNVLVVASEIMSRRITDADPDTAILFGDGAGAALVSPGAGLLRIADLALFTDGSFADSLYLAPGGTIQMKGLDVILHASRKIPRAILDVLERNQLAADNLGVCLMHQANLNLIKKVAAALKLSEDRFFTNIARYGNTSSASLLIAAAEWSESLTAAPDKPVVFATFGAGFHWGALLALPTIPD